MNIGHRLGSVVQILIATKKSSEEMGNWCNRQDLQHRHEELRFLSTHIKLGSCNQNSGKAKTGGLLGLSSQQV